MGPLQGAKPRGFEQLGLWLYAFSRNGWKVETLYIPS